MDVLVFPFGKDDPDELNYSRSSSMQVHMFQYPVNDSLLIFGHNNMVHVLAAAKKIAVLQALGTKDDAKEFDLVLHERSKDNMNGKAVGARGAVQFFLCVFCRSFSFVVRERNWMRVEDVAGRWVHGFQIKRNENKPSFNAIHFNHSIAADFEHMMKVIRNSGKGKRVGLLLSEKKDIATKGNFAPKFIAELEKVPRGAGWVDGCRGAVDSACFVSNSFFFSLSRAFGVVFCVRHPVD